MVEQLYLAGDKSLEPYAKQAAAFVCHVLPNNPWSQVAYTPGDDTMMILLLISVAKHRMILPYHRHGGNIYSEHCVLVGMCRWVAVCSSGSQHTVCDRILFHNCCLSRFSGKRKRSSIDVWQCVV